MLDITFVLDSLLFHNHVYRKSLQTRLEYVDMLNNLLYLMVLFLLLYLKIFLIHLKIVEFYYRKRKDRVYSILNSVLIICLYLPCFMCRC